MGRFRLLAPDVTNVGLGPLQPRYAKQVADADSLMAAIIAQAMNHGNLVIAKTSDIPYHVLEETYRQYLRQASLQAASDRIGLTGDPGLLPVRVKISEEIADLKTRKRADLVGMTLILQQLARQVRVLEPGFEQRVDQTAAAPPPAPEEGGDILERINRVVDSLVTVRYQGDRKPSAVEASVIDVGEKLEDNLKLARWSVLERDASQYRNLIDESIRLFREFYDLDNAANGDFLDQLQDLQKMQLKPEKPDIGGSLRELQRILSQRENAPEPAGGKPAEAGDG